MLDATTPTAVIAAKKFVVRSIFSRAIERKRRTSSRAAGRKTLHPAV